ncbi:Plant intracellular Ras-group-related LRR protein 5 [Vitis vinifera]|uniref:Plant intracellular Ras-group-related LRR protein 5 n=1 Tax=Vitis vinifera TaxID=29760 RepID=A0A438EQE8_VITVI|nr:Plant intracellular Ras-group-related LRR protein 5 [Vitis vinifera]
MAGMSKQDPSPAFAETVEEIMRIYRSLPPRPKIEEVEAAMTVIRTADSEEQKRLEEVARQEVPQGVPPELFSVLQQARKTMVLFQCHEEREEALHLVERNKLFNTFDELIQRASEVVSGGVPIEKQIDLGDPVGKSGRKDVISVESLIKRGEDEESGADGFKGLVRSSSAKAIFVSGEDDTEKFNLMKVAALIEKTAKIKAGVLDLQGKLMEKIEWLPTSIGKLSDITELNLSENRIMALPSTMSGLRALTKLDVHSNQLINLPDSIGELVNLADLDLHANRLRSLPASFGNLVNLINLNLSSNQFTHLPDNIGSLTSLKRLNVDTNELEEVPYTIGSCTSLLELRLDFNQLRALPEAVGKLECLEILTLHYNRIKGLPTTIDLRALPRSIGNLEMLEELDISDCQIRMLPDSFRFLSKLRVLRADETPLEVPPREEVVQYMADLTTKWEARPLSSKKGFWFWVCSIFRARTKRTTDSKESQKLDE